MALCALCMCLAFAPVPAAAKDGHVTILTLSQLQSQLLPFAEKVNRDTVLMGGLSHAAGVVDQVRRSDPDAILVTTGESVFGAVWQYFGGEPEFSALTAAGVQVGMIGKHEMDNGWPHLKNALQYAGYPLLLSNGIVSGDEESLKKTVIIPYGEMKVGFFALISPTLLRTTSQWSEEEIKLLPDLHEVAHRMVDDLKAQGADVIFLISNLTEAENEELADTVSGIHIIFGRGVEAKDPAKPLFVTNSEGWTTALVWGSTRGRFVGQLRLDTKEGRISEDSVSWQPLPVNQKTEASEAVFKIASDFEARLNEHRERIIGVFETPVNMRKTAVRSREMPIGNFVSDAYRTICKADIALVNGGSIRTDRVLPAGEFSEKTMLEIFPYGNEIVVITLKGSALRQAMELSASALKAPGEDYDTSFRTPTGGFLQVSGLRVTYEQTRPATTFDPDGTQVKEWGSRLTGLEVERDGQWKTVEDDAEYTVAMSAYLAGGGDRYFMFRDAPRQETGKSDLRVTVDYINTFPDGHLKLDTDGRIVIKSSKN